MKRPKEKAESRDPAVTHATRERDTQTDRNILDPLIFGKRIYRIRQFFYRTMAGACDFLAEWQAHDAEAKRTQVFQLISWRERLLIRGGLR